MSILMYNVILLVLKSRLCMSILSSCVSYILYYILDYISYILILILTYMLYIIHDIYTQGPKLWTLAQNIFQHTYTHNTHTSNNIYTIQSILKVNNNNNITIIQRKFGLLFGCIAGLLMYINTLIAAFLYTVLGMYCILVLLYVIVYYTSFNAYITYKSYTNLYCMRLYAFACYDSTYMSCTYTL